MTEGIRQLDGMYAGWRNGRNGHAPCRKEDRCDMEAEIAKVRSDRERRKLIDACWTCPKFGASNWGETSCTGCKPDCPRVVRCFEEKGK